MLIIGASYSVAPELLQISLPDVATPGDGGDSGGGGDPGEDPLPPGPGDPNGPFSGIPPCLTGKSLLELEDPTAEEEPLETETSECGPTECDAGAEGTFSEEKECIEDGKRECESAGARVTVMACPGSVTKESECVPGPKQVLVDGDCSFVSAPGCGNVVTEVRNALDCSACWIVSDDGDKSLSCETIAGTLAVGVACTLGDPQDGQDGVQIDKSKCALDLTSLECAGSCDVTILDSKQGCAPKQPLGGQCKNLISKPPSLSGRDATGSSSTNSGPTTSPALPNFFQSFFK